MGPEIHTGVQSRSRILRAIHSQWTKTGELIKLVSCYIFFYKIGVENGPLEMKVSVKYD